MTWIVLVALLHGLARGIAATIDRIWFRWTTSFARADEMRRHYSVATLGR